MRKLPLDARPMRKLPFDPLPFDPLPFDPLPFDPLPFDPLPFDPRPFDPRPTRKLPFDPPQAALRSPASCPSIPRPAWALRVHVCASFPAEAPPDSDDPAPQMLGHARQATATPPVRF
jgi:hypothetical protein